MTSRFQTLEDLQTELQDLLKSLNKELVDLVNDNYTSFLSLGQKLSGGEERIEEIRVGLLGFQRDVSAIRQLVDARAKETSVLLEEKRSLRKDIQVGRALLEVDERLVELERRLNLAPRNTRYDTSDTKDDGNDGGNDDEETMGDFKDWSDDWLQNDVDPGISDEDEDAGADLPDLPRALRKNVEQFLIVRQLSEKCGLQHPFVLAQVDRVNVIGNILRKDLEAATRAQSDVKAKQRIIRLKTKLEDHE